jgi:hypothetical protein
VWCVGDGKVYLVMVVLEVAVGLCTYVTGTMIGNRLFPDVCAGVTMV